MSDELGEYFEDSRRLSVSLVLVLPLLAAYEAGVLIVRSPVENHAGLLVKEMIRVLGMDAYLILTGLVAISFGAALFLKHRGPARRFRLYGLMIVEAAVYAAILGPLVVHLGRVLSSPSTSPAYRALLYVGAGVWEELVFRLLLLGGFLWLTTRAMKGNPVVFGILGILFSSLLFSLFHHVGELGEAFRSDVFLFRLIAGGVLGSLYVLRGLGVVVYTHALYDIGLLVTGER